MPLVHPPGYAPVVCDIVERRYVFNLLNVENDLSAVDVTGMVRTMHSSLLNIDLLTVTVFITSHNVRRLVTL